MLTEKQIRPCRHFHLFTNQVANHHLSTQSICLLNLQLKGPLHAMWKQGEAESALGGRKTQGREKRKSHFDIWLFLHNHHAHTTGLRFLVL